MDPKEKLWLYGGGAVLLVAIVAISRSKSSSTTYDTGAGVTATQQAEINASVAINSLDQQRQIAVAQDLTDIQLARVQGNNAVNLATVQGKNSLEIAGIVKDITLAGYRHETTLAQVTGANAVNEIKANKPSFLDQLGGFLKDLSGFILPSKPPTPAPSGG